METEMPKIVKSKLIRLGSAKRLTRGGDIGGMEFLTLRQIVGG